MLHDAEASDVPDPTADAPASRVSIRAAFHNLSLARKVALIPALTLLLMGLMLATALQMGSRNTAALRALDRDVFEPLSLAQTRKDGVTLLHTQLFALLSVGINQADPAAQNANAADLIGRLSAETAAFNHFLDSIATVVPLVIPGIRKSFAAYAARVQDTADFAAYDASYGALVAGLADERFGRLRADFDVVVAALAERRASLVREVVGDSLADERLLFSIGLGAALLALVGSIAVGTQIARPLMRLTALMRRLASGDTDLPVPGTERRDEVGAMARTVRVFRANAVARRLGEAALRRTNLQFDAALNSMMQGMVVWGPDHRVQLVNARFFSLCGLPEESIGPGMTISEVVASVMRHGLHPEDSFDVVNGKVTGMATARRSTQTEREFRPGLFVRVASEPMANGGCVNTFEDVTEKHHNEEQISYLARHDALTGLANRTLFQGHMSAAISRIQDGQEYAVLCLDLDHFKEVNDTLGHGAGDELLRLVAGRLRNCARDRDVVARLGGDEFAILLVCDADGAGAATSLATRLVTAIGAPYEVQGHNIVIGTSIGIALPTPGSSGTDLLKQADVALYRAKEERGTFAFFEPGMDEHLHTRRGLEADLRLAIQRNEFELHYQPLYNFMEGRITAFEALVRWNSPTRGRVSPDNFIPVAEQSGLITPIGEWVLRTACAEAAGWPDHVRVAVNLSAVQFKSKRLVELVREALQDVGLPARRLELEITETVLLQDTESVMTMLHGLHELGVRVSMDDFGTGYSSLSYLRRFPFDKIKIDRSFVGDLRTAIPDSESLSAAGQLNLATANSAAMIVRAISGLGENLGISTTAEGVETIEQLAQIHNEGCTEVQGYFISPPRPASEIDSLRRQLDATLPSILSRRLGVDHLAG